MRLTADEIKLVTFLVLALVVGAIVKHYRHRDRPTFPPAAVAATPSPAESAEP